MSGGSLAVVSEVRQQQFRFNSKNVLYLGIRSVSSFKKAAIKKAIIVGAITGLVVSFLSDLDPAFAILIGVASGLVADRIISKRWP